MRKKILVVDDQKINRAILRKILESTYEVWEAENGVIALKMIKELGTELSAVVLDLIMPELDGYGVLVAMSDSKEYPSIPVIVASQASELGTEEKAFRCGARDFILKPYNPGVLKQRLKNLIELYESNLCITHIERDTLTGLYTKDAFYRQASKMLEENKDIRYMIMAVNVEKFKLVNDSYGNEEGDKLLVYISDHLQKSTAAAGGVCGRNSADRFYALIPVSEEGHSLQRIVEDAKKDCAKYPLGMKLSVKFGAYFIEERNLPVSLMCDRAMLAAEKIKGKYDVSYAYYDDSIRQRLLREQRITDQMKNALANHEFHVYMQPKYDLVSESIAGAEALVRWTHPELGFISPAEFIPLFERNGFITELDEYVWDKTCETIALWIEKRKKFVPVSVNVSRKDIYNEDLPELLMGIVSKHGLKPEHLHLEITETAYTEDAQQLISVVGRMKELGFIIEMDDFGSGYSSLNMLSELPIDILKLDMRFIQRETEKNNSRSILSFVISMAKWMKLTVVAEGVETKEQINLLRNMDCDLVQGYYYAKPMPTEEFTKLVFKSNLAVDTAESKEDETFIQRTDNTGAKSKVMLIVDDIEVNRAILAECFRSYYAIVEAADGEEAYMYVQEHFDDIAIIMLDLIMPKMDGFQFLKKLQINALYSTIPVIVTSQVGRDSEVEAFRLGASDFLSKPYDCDIALHRVQNVTAKTEVKVLQREKQMLIKMRRLAMEAKLDQFTGVYNRMEMERQIQEYFYGEEHLSGIFIMLDIDDFKKVNDTYGHAAGDEAIRKVAEILVQRFREEDIISRMGGDEFAVFVKTGIEVRELEVKLTSLCSHLNFMVQNLKVSCSIGVSIAPEHGRDYQELYHSADVALLTAKRLGKNQFNIFSGEVELPDRILYRNMDWLLDESSDAIFIGDTDTYEIYYLNKAACALAGKEKAKCLGVPCYKAIWDLDEPCSHCIHIENMSRDYCEHEVHPNNSDKTYLSKGKLIDWGEKKARIQYVQDYTQQYNLREKLTEVSRNQQLLLSQLPCGLYRYRKSDGKFTYINDKMLSMLGYTRQEFAKKFDDNFFQMIWHEDKERMIKVIADQNLKLQHGVSEYRIERKDGTLCWVHDTACIGEGKSGDEYYVVSIDITDEKMIQV